MKRLLYSPFDQELGTNKQGFTLMHPIGTTILKATTTVHQFYETLALVGQSLRCIRNQYLLTTVMIG